MNARQRKCHWETALVVLLLAANALEAAAAQQPPPLPIVRNVDAQPLLAQVRRLIEAADWLGSPLPAADRRALEAAARLADPMAAIEEVQRILDPHCLVFVDINPEARVKVSRGPAAPDLLEQGWRQFLVKVRNEAGTTAELRCTSPHAQSPFSGGQSPRTVSDEAFLGSASAEALPVTDRWLDIQMPGRQPLTPTLGGLTIEYRIIQLYSRDAGRREATLVFDVGLGTQDLGFRSELPVLFACRPAHAITLRVRDEHGQPTVGAFVIRDAHGRIYPSRAKRLAPDFAFQPQVYRADGELLRLPTGSYTVEFSRGPESLREVRTLTVASGPQVADFRVRRWIDPAAFGWWSGDHHIHAAGCMHYVKPTEGVRPEEIMRHVVGEDLKVGAALTWGPGFDYQNQFFCGAVDKVSRYPNLLRYDLEISDFGSDQSGHLALLRLKDVRYPGSSSIVGWPTLGLNTLRWAKAQGAVAGAAHSGWGLDVPGTELPSYAVPKFNSIGANEYIVDVTHEVPGPAGVSEPAVDFISVVDTHPAYELNIWYHTLNAGYRTRIAGETDFPCIYGERVGMGRSYVKLDGPLDYNSWCEGIRLGRCYVSDGKSHLIGFRAGGVAVGEQGSELRLDSPGKIVVTVKAAALLADNPDARLHGLGSVTGEWGADEDKPYWDIERARIGGSREVPVEVIVNGYPVAVQNITADGVLNDLKFEVDIARSSWVALRILGSSHTNPVFVIVGGKPVRASRRSVEWCLKGVDQCWSQKERFIALAEIAEARAAYEHAREAYRRRLAECDTD